MSGGHHPSKEAHDVQYPSTPDTVAPAPEAALLLDCERLDVYRVASSSRFSPVACARSATPSSVISLRRATSAFRSNMAEGASQWSREVPPPSLRAHHGEFGSPTQYERAAGRRRHLSDGRQGHQGRPRQAHARGTMSSTSRSAASAGARRRIFNLSGRGGRDGVCWWTGTGVGGAGVTVGRRDRRTDPRCREREIGSARPCGWYDARARTAGVLRRAM